MKLVGYFEDAFETARSGRNAASFVVEFAQLRHRLTRALEATRAEDPARVLRELERVYLRRIDDLTKASSRTGMVREWTEVWLEAVERSGTEEQPSAVAYLYAEAAATEDDDDREFYDATAAAVARRWPN